MIPSQLSYRVFREMGPWALIWIITVFPTSGHQLYLCSGPFNWCHAMTTLFGSFQTNKKMTSIVHLIMSNLVNLQSFIRIICCKLIKLWHPKTYKEKLGVLRSYELEWTWMKLHLLTKFDVINWAMQFIIFLMRKSRKCDISKIRAHSLVGLLQSGGIWIILQLDSNSFE